MDNIDYISAADTSNVQAGGTSIYDSILGAAGPGTIGAVVSGFNAIANTGIDLTNKIFGSTIDRVSTIDTLNKIDSSFGDYYQQHQGGVDATGMLLGSLLPGTLAIKGLKLAQAGEMGGAFKSILGFASTRETAYLQSALDQLAVEGGTVFTRINQNKLLSMAWGTADQVLQAAAYETATALTMKASPVLDADSWTDIGWDIVKTGLSGGALGGALGAFATNKFIKTAGNLVEAKLRPLDVVDRIGATDLDFGDKAFSIINALTKLPKEALDGTVQLTNVPKGIVPTLDISRLQSTTLATTISRGLTEFQDSLVNVVPGDVTVGKAFASGLMKIAQAGTEAGANTPEIRKTLLNYLGNLKSVEAIGARPLSVAGDVQYLDASADLATQSPFTTTRPGPGATPYRVIGDQSQTKIGTYGKDALTAQEAWDAGFDVMIDPKTKHLSVNPQSQIYQRITQEDADSSLMFLNTRSLATSFDTVPTAADLATAEHPLDVNIGGVQSGDKTWTYKTDVYNAPVTAADATSRMAWASELKKIYGRIDANDLALLDAMLENPSRAMPGVSIYIPETGKTVLKDEIPDFASFVFDRKYNSAIKLLQDAGEKADLRTIAYKLNVTPEWLENATSTQFSTQEAFNHTGWKQSISQYMDRQNLVLRYDTKGIAAANEEASNVVAYYTRVQEAQQRVQDATAAVLGDAYKNFPVIEGSMAMDATSQTVGASMFGASNPSLSDIRSTLQYVGQQTTKTATDRSNDVMKVIQTPLSVAMQDPRVMGELGMFLAKVRTTPEGMALYTDAGGQAHLVDLPSYRAVQNGMHPKFATDIPLSEEAANVIDTHHYLYLQRMDQENTLLAAQGVYRDLSRDRLYAPPVDTKKFPYFAFVKHKEGKLFGSSDTAMISAKSADELQSMIAQVQSDPSLVVLTKGDTAAYYKAKGDYDYSQGLNASQLNSELQSKFKLTNYYPNLTPEAVAEEFVNYHVKAETKLVRDAVAANYGPTFADLDGLSERYMQAADSAFRATGSRLQGAPTDPFGDYKRLALGVSKQSDYTIWQDMNDFVDAQGTRAYRAMSQAVLDARSNKISWDDANNLAETFGFGKRYPDETAFNLAQTAPDRNLLKIAISKANAILSTGIIRLDQINSLINTISTPILAGTFVSAFKNMVANDPQLAALYEGLTNIKVPGQPLQVPSLLRLLGNAIADYPGDKGGLMKRFQDIGTVKDTGSLFQDFIRDVSLTPNIIPKDFAAKVDGWVEKAASLSFNQRAEDFTRYVSSHIGMQLTDPLVQAGRITIQDQNALISNIVNKIQGNYVPSQRPMIFQGTLGSAVGLFQTYQFNLLQQLFGHIENKDAKTVATLLGLQTGIFGLNGLPLFDAINTHLIGGANINPQHKDAYSAATTIAGRELGDWLMYGTASAFPLARGVLPALYSRGDINPRNISVIPISPLDVPAVSASIKLVQNLVNMGKMVANGSDISGALLQGLEHNGISRPLAGIAQIMQGASTTTQGNLIAANSDILSIANFARIAGAKPLDEAVASNELYRSQVYQAMDKERTDVVGEAIKQKLRGNQPITDDDWSTFQAKYAAAGGNIQGFARAVQRWNKEANVSVVNSVMQHSKTMKGQMLNEVLGGDSLADFNNQLNQP
jgi:hypothetical protein